MFKNLKLKIKRNLELTALISLILITVFFTVYYNYSKKKINQTHDKFIENIYLKKTLNYIVENLEPKYKNVKHKVESGETFDKILENYSIEKKEIIKIKNSLKNQININKLSTKQIIEFSLDKTNNKIEEFTFQISNTQKIKLKRNKDKDLFSEEILSIKLNKIIAYKENIIQKVYTHQHIIKKSHLI